MSLDETEQTRMRERLVVGIDIGTLTCRLLVATVTSNGEIIPVQTDRRILRLGEGVDKSKRLTLSAMARVIETLRAWRNDLARYPVVATMVVATSAVREAENQHEFLELVRKATDFEIEVLTGAKEAEYTLRGIRAGLPVEVKQFIGLDIGGGSTEFMRACDHERPSLCSIDVGVVRMTERFLQSDPPTKAAIGQLEHLVRKEVERIGGDFCWTPETTLVGTAGTITTLAALVQRLTDYDPSKIHSFVLDLATVREWDQRLRTSTRSSRRALPGLEAGREDVIVTGTILLRVIMEQLGFDRCVVSEYGLREGIVWEAARRVRENGEQQEFT
ncbi:MAG: Ppx/GppA family phosphatase [Nitrospirae bacterium]|nr:MAG: Ppx/GppA family phosphatase [Nitrospirota bacterium]